MNLLGQVAKDSGNMGSLLLLGIRYPRRRRNTPVVRSVGSRNESLVVDVEQGGPLLVINGVITLINGLIIG